MTTEQQTNLKFRVRLGKSPTKALSMLQQVNKEHTLFRATVFFFVWHKRFKEGRENDNAPAHTSLSIRRFLADKNVRSTMLEQPPIHLILLHVTFSFFAKFKTSLKKHVFQAQMPLKML